MLAQTPPLAPLARWTHEVSIRPPERARYCNQGIAKHESIEASHDFMRRHRDVVTCDHASAGKSG